MRRLVVAPLSILFLAVGLYAAILNFTFTVTSATVTTSGTTMSVSGNATLTVSGVGSDYGTISASGSLANISGGNVTVPFKITLGYGNLTGSITYPETALVNPGPVGGTSTITGGTGLYSGYSSTVPASGLTGPLLSLGTLSFSSSGTDENGRSYTFTVTNATVTVTGTTQFSGPATLTLAGTPDTGMFNASGSLNNISGGNVTAPFTVKLGQGNITGNMTFPETALVNSGPVSGSATITGGTGSYAGYTSSTLTGSGTVTGAMLSGGTFSFSVSGTVNTPPPPPPAISAVAPLYSTLTSIQPGSWVSIYGNNLIAGTTPQSWNSDYPTTLGGISVAIDNKPAYLSYASSTLINLQPPDDTTRGQVNVVVTTPNPTSPVPVRR